MPLRISPRVRRVAVATAALATFVVLAGATYQGVATALERRQFPRPGGLVDVGGHQLHIYCTGKGSPAVVLEAGAGSMSPSWAWIQPEVARTTRVCGYDRAGLGWSEAGDGVYEPARVPGELRALLKEGREEPPFVLVGYELGALFARMFAARYPGDVAALVLVDEVAAAGATPKVPWPGSWPWLARAGVLRASGSLAVLAAGLPGESGGAMRAFLNRPDHLTRAAMEIDRIAETEAAVRGLTLDPALIVTEVTLGSRVQPSLISSREHAARVARAIDAALREWRRRSATSSPER